jgi:hypothetical protein
MEALFTYQSLRGLLWFVNNTVSNQSGHRGRDGLSKFFTDVGLGGMKEHRLTDWGA